MSALKSLCALALAAGLVAMPAVAQDQLPLPKGFDTDCFETELLGCYVTSAGVTGMAGDVQIAFQVQSGYSEDTGIGAGVVLLEAVDGAWRVLASDFYGVFYEMPRIADGEVSILHVPGFTAGTGGYNADLLLIRPYEEDAQWQRIDIESWRGDVVELLPEGLEIWKGVDFDFGDWFWSDYNARTPLWTGGDANCCPTGGWAIIEFEIADGRLVPTRVHYRPETE